MTIAPNASEPLDMIAPVATERGLDTVLHDVGGHMATVYGAQTTHHIYF